MKTIIVTGATGAIGWAATQTLLSRGYYVIMACRNTEKAENLRATLHPSVKVNSKVMYIEMSSLNSIHSFTSLIAQDTVIPPIYGLLNNAGTLQRHYTQSIDGYELTYAINFIAPAVLTLELLPLIAPNGVIVFTTSLACYISNTNRNLEALNSTKFRQVRAYADSKMAITLFSQALALKYHDTLRINATDPGIVNSQLLHMERWFDPLSDLLFRPLCKTPAQGAIPAIEALFATSTNHLFRSTHNIPFPSRFVNNTVGNELLQQIESMIDPPQNSQRVLTKNV